MKKAVFYLVLAFVLVHAGCKTKITDQHQLVNPVIGDVSFVAKFGYQPDEKVNEELRVKTHLEYAENLLLKRDVRHLSATLQANRKHIVELLHNYWAKGIFPRNYDYKNERRPCFIDKENRICAVGYLIEQTAGRKVAEAINAKFKYDEVLAMNDKAVDNWIEKSGLTKEECAIIQPTYGPQPTYTYNHIPAGYGISSSVLSGINLSATVLNGVQISKGTNKKTVAVLSLITGTGQTVLGIAGFPKNTENRFYGNTSNESKKTLSMINIGLGTSTMIMSAWNIITNKKSRGKKITWNVNSFQTPGNNTGIVFSLTSKL